MLMYVKSVLQYIQKYVTANADTSIGSVDKQKNFTMGHLERMVACVRFAPTRSWTFCY